MRVLWLVLVMTGCGGMQAADGGADSPVGGGTLEGRYVGTGTATSGDAEALASGYTLTVRHAAVGAGLVAMTDQDPENPGTWLTCSLPLHDDGTDDHARVSGLTAVCIPYIDCTLAAARLVVSPAGHAVLDATLSCPAGAAVALHVEGDRR